MKRFRNHILLGILLIASFLRLYQLDQIPPGILPDEADMGYSAYSILHTGLSQYGTFNPLAIQEWSGGSHPPAYTYVLIPLFKFFGMNIFMDRLPSAIFGIGLVAVVFYIVKHLFKRIEIAYLAALLTALNPWAMQLSRQGLLESIAVFFVALGILFFLWSEKNSKFYILSAISFGISLFSYDAPKIFLPLFIPVLLLYRYKTTYFDKKSIVQFLLIFGVFYALIIKGLLFDGNTKDFMLVRSSTADLVNMERTLTNAPLSISSIFHNKLSVTIDRFFVNYFRMFTMNAMFFNGTGNFIHSIGPHGQFHTYTLPFFFIGIYQLLKSKKKEGLLLFGWLLLGPVPGAITDMNNPFRSSLLLPVPIILSSFGIFWFFTYIKQWKSLLRFGAISVILITASVHIISYLVTYFYDFPVYGSAWWRHEENKALEFAHSQRNNYQSIFVTDNLENNYAFAFAIDPKEFQKSYMKKEQYNGVEYVKLNNIYFGKFDHDHTASISAYYPPNSLIIVKGNHHGDEKSIKDFYKLKTVEVLFRAIETPKTK